MCALAQDFLQEQDFPERNLLQRASRPRRSSSPWCIFRRDCSSGGLQSGEECSGVVLEPRWSKLLHKQGCQPKYKKKSF
jgi:hypothetical protein